MTAEPAHSERVKAARAVVYDEAGELIDADDLPDALEAAGVTVVESDDDGLEYRDVPADLPLAACHWRWICEKILLLSSRQRVLTESHASF